MKKIIIIILLIITALSTFGCKKDEEKPSDVSIITPSGTPLFALGNLLSNLENLEIVNDPTLLQTALIKGETDIVICPLTLGTNLYLNKKSSYKLFSVITINNTYLVSNSTITDYNSLNNETIVSFNENNTPGVMTKMFLSKHNITAEVIYEANVNMATQAFLSGNTNYAVVSEPQLTQIEMKKDISYIDLSDSVEADFIPQAVLFVNANKTNDSEVLKVLNQIELNVKEIQNNTSDYITTLLGTNNQFINTLGSQVLERALPRSNISFYKAKENKETIIQFYNYLNETINLFKGNIPDEDFYI